MTIFVVRHAWAGQHGDPRYPNDDQRPLTDKGRKRFKRLVRKLVKRGFDPLSIATSALVRAEQTAQIIAENCPSSTAVTVLEDLSPGGRLEPLVEWARCQAPADVAWVGHSPDVERLAAGLIGSEESRLRFDKGAVAAIRFHDSIAAGAGELAWLVNAELFRC